MFSESKLCFSCFHTDGFDPHDKTELQSMENFVEFPRLPTFPKSNENDQ